MSDGEQERKQRSSPWNHSSLGDSAVDTQFRSFEFAAVRSGLPSPSDPKPSRDGTPHVCRTASVASLVRRLDDDIPRVSAGVGLLL